MNFDKFVGPTTQRNNKKTLGVNNQRMAKLGPLRWGPWLGLHGLGGHHVGPNVRSNTYNVNK